MKVLRVTAFWDDEAKVFVAESEDVPGLAAEADSPDALIKKLQVLIPELLDLNGYPDGDEIPFRLTFDDLEAVSHRQTRRNRLAFWRWRRTYGLTRAGASLSVRSTLSRPQKSESSLKLRKA